MKINRYPGIYSFSKEQKNSFFGREKDIEKLITILEVEKHILLYSKSGIGKTSLIHAGLLPKLPSNYKSMVVRFFDTKSTIISPAKRLLVLLQKQFKKELSTEIPIIDKLIILDPANTIWYLLKKIKIVFEAEINSKSSFLIILDQFEEFFTYSDRKRNDFIDIVIDLLFNKLPNGAAKHIATILKDNKEIKNSDVALLYKSSNVKILFSIRDDKLNLLNEISYKMLNIQNIFYELKSLSYEQARQAIIHPAIIENEKYKSPSFIYSDSASTKILDFLSKGFSTDIESAQLQIICHKIEQNIISRNLKEGTTITENDIPSFKNIFLDFYKEAIEALPQEKQLSAKLLVETELIKKGKRISVDANSCYEYISENELKILVDKFLIRMVPNSLKRYSYELAHDTLIPSIVEIARKRIDEEKAAITIQKAKEEAEKQKKIEAEKTVIAEKEALKQKQINLIQRKRNIAITIAAIISIFFAVFGILAWLNAKSIFHEYKESLFNQYITEVNIDINNCNNADVLVLLDSAASLEINTDTVQKLKDLLNQKLILKPLFDSLIREGNVFFNNKDFIKAYYPYKQALDLHYCDRNAIKKIFNIKRNGAKYYLDKIKEENTEPEIYVYLSCVYCIRDMNDSALVYLERAAKEDYKDAYFLETEQILDSLRLFPEFDTILNTVKQNNQ